MKTIFLFVAMITTSLATQAQGNLQFNQVKLINTNSTVPTGKVWKVESVLHGDNSSWTEGVPSIDCIMSIVLNNENICISRLRTFYASGYNYDVTSSESAINCTSLPIWLPEGTTISLGYNSKFVSIIEYNIVFYYNHVRYLDI